ncbi:MAG: hypothetical protein IJV24_07310 [Prevotella sp.]|nr:hypothetical protein [Prevotella sp.]
MEKGLPIRNITIDPVGGELRERARNFLKSIGFEARFFIDDAVIMTGAGKED